MTRVVYSYLGQGGYASLRDVNENLEPTSEVHFKRRIERVLDSMLKIYPELISAFPVDHSEVSSDILEIYLSTGCVYHEPRRLVAPVRKEAIDSRCKFYRGQALDEEKWLSGLGCYKFNDSGGASERLCFSDMFLWQTEPLKSVWQKTIENASWSKMPENASCEYLRCHPPFTNSYWISKPDIDDGVTLARIHEASHSLFYLFRLNGSEKLMSPLPVWMTDNKNHWAISNAQLASLGALPPTRVHFDGDIVYLHIGYLYPPDVLNAVRLYSWPDSCCNLPRLFHRIMSGSVFLELRGILEAMEYQFQEE